MKKIIAISGSLRKASINTHLLREAQKFSSDYEVEIASISDIPLYNLDIEETSGIPGPVTLLKNKIIEASGLLISTPEFNHSIPGVLKNAVDWLSRPTADIAKVFGNLPTGVIGSASGHFGTVFAQVAWLPILQRLNARPYFEKSLYVGAHHTVFTPEGKIHDEVTLKRLKDYMEGFLKFVEGSN